MVSGAKQTSQSARNTGCVGADPPCLLHVYGCVCVHTHPYTCTCTGCMYEHVAWCGRMYMYIVHVCVYMYIHVHMSIVEGDP